MVKAKLPVPEFSRPLEVARVPKLGSHEKLDATPAECKALARRLGVPAVNSLTATLHAKPWRGGGLQVKGELIARLDRESVVSLEQFATTETLAVERYFLAVPAGADLESDEDIDEIVGGFVDLGELVAETLALDMEPYPRMPGETFASAEPAEAPEEEKIPNPFKALK
jgi:uncharacterized metal-binding protein YceD (DUF177 family)